MIARNNRAAPLIRATTWSCFDWRMTRVPAIKNGRKQKNVSRWDESPRWNEWFHERNRVAAQMRALVLLKIFAPKTNGSPTISVHSAAQPRPKYNCSGLGARYMVCASPAETDRKSTRLNSSHLVISYAVFCLK